MKEAELHVCVSVCATGVLEVAKGMEKLGVTLDIETLSNYILPVFSDMETARQALKVSGRLGLCFEVSEKVIATEM